MAYQLHVKYFNAFWLKKVVGDDDATVQATPANTAPNAINTVANTGAVMGVELATWPGLPWNPEGYPKFPWGLSSDNTNTCGVFECTADPTCTNPEWFVEESRIRGGYNNTTIDLGVKAYIVEETNAQQHRSNSLIYSGIYNSRTGINNTNVFSVGEDITKSVDPTHGSIQKLYAENTDLLIFQENKVSRALIDKDAIYTAEGSPMKTQSNVVIGQTVPYLGEYGISKNPESFAIYGYRKYFADRDRGVILRLSRDGIEEISRYGMTNYFKDYLATISNEWQEVDLHFPKGLVDVTNNVNTIYVDTTTANSTRCPCSTIEPGMALILSGVNTELYVTEIDSAQSDDRDVNCTIKLNKAIDFTNYNYSDVVFRKWVKSKIVGGWDIHSRNYTLSMQPSEYTSTCDIEPTYNTLGFDEQINGWVSFYTYKPLFVDSLKNRFYSFVDNNLYKHYNEDENYERGMFYGIQSDSNISFVLNPEVSMSKNFLTINYEGSNGWEVDSFSSDFQGDYNMSLTQQQQFPAWSFEDNFDSANKIYSYDEGVYTDPNDGVIYRAGFTKKENKYSANLVNNSVTKTDEVIIGPDGFVGSSMSGIKGYFATVTMSTDNSTRLGSKKELFAVSASYVNSSY